MGFSSGSRSWFISSVHQSAHGPSAGVRLAESPGTKRCLGTADNGPTWTWERDGNTCHNAWKLPAGGGFKIRQWIQLAASTHTAQWNKARKLGPVVKHSRHEAITQCCTCLGTGARCKTHNNTMQTVSSLVFCFFPTPKVHWLLCLLKNARQ